MQWLRSCEITVFSAIFDTNERLLTGRKFSSTGSILSFLISGMTSATFQLLGIQLLSNEKLNILAMISVTVSTHFFASQAGIDCYGLGLGLGLGLGFRVYLGLGIRVSFFCNVPFFGFSCRNE